jgi:DNA-binding GntR family transcriptional regulator
MPHPPVPFDLRSAREAFGTAGRLQADATRLGADKLAPGDLDRLRAADAAYVDALADGRIEDAIAADDGFHQVLLGAAGDPDLQVSVDLLLPRLRRMDLFVFARKSLQRGENTHPQVIEALERGDAETAAQLVEASYQEAADALAAAIDR